jgi:hypothetical protein
MENKTELVGLFLEMLHTLQRIEAKLGGANGRSSGAAVADDEDLDSKYGDPEIRFLPRDWHGDDFKGCNFSQAPAELLDLLAKAFDYFADRDEKSGATANNGKPKAQYNRLDAARARGWAARIRSGWTAAGTATPASSAPAVFDETSDFGDEGEPF